MVLDQPEGFGRVEPFHQQDRCSMLDRHPEDRVERVDVEQRERQQRHVVVGKRQPGNGRHLVQVGGQVPVGQHRALGRGGRAGGVCDHGQVIRVGRSRSCRPRSLIGEHLLERERAARRGRSTDDQDALQVGQSIPDGQEGRQRSEFGHHNLRPGVRQGVPDLLRRQHDIQRARGRSGPKDPVQRGDELRNVPGQEGHPVAASDSEPGQCRGRQVDPLVQLGERHRPAAKQDRRSLGIGAPCVSHQIGKVHGSSSPNQPRPVTGQRIPTPYND